MADKQLSRSDFLKAGGVIAVSVALAAWDTNRRVDGLVTNSAVLDTIINNGSNISVEQRKQKILEALEKSAFKPEIFGSFAKFLALEVHANFKGYYTARDTIRNFLFGEGKELDITNSLAESLRKEPQWLDGQFDRNFASDREILQALTKHTYENSVELKKRDPTNTNVSFNSNEKGSLEARLVGDNANTDTFYSLYKFRISVDGKIDSSGITADCKLTDRYDWDGRVSDAASLTYGQAAEIAIEYLEFLGIRRSKDDILKLIGINEGESAEQFVSIDDRDGLRLQEAGVGKPFNIYANWKVINMKVIESLN